MWKCEMKNVMIWGRFQVHHEADKNSMNLCQLIPTHYEKQQISTSLADERIDDEGYDQCDAINIVTGC